MWVKIKAAIKLDKFAVVITDKFSPPDSRVIIIANDKIPSSGNCKAMD